MHTISKSHEVGEWSLLGGEGLFHSARVASLILCKIIHSEMGSKKQKLPHTVEIYRRFCLKFRVWKAQGFDWGRIKCFYRIQKWSTVNPVWTFCERTFGTATLLPKEIFQFHYTLVSTIALITRIEIHFKV